MKGTSRAGVAAAGAAGRRLGLRFCSRVGAAAAGAVQVRGRRGRSLRISTAMRLRSRGWAQGLAAHALLPVFWRGAQGQARRRTQEQRPEARVMEQ